MELSVRELTESDIPLISDYWTFYEAPFMEGMGVDVSKLPTREALGIMLRDQIKQSYKEKKAYSLIWVVDGEAVGHNNVNRIVYGESAYMHLHMWKAGLRKQGIGTELVKLALPFFFKNLELQKIYCEPYALNPAPNKTLEKLGFTFVKKHTYVPGPICFEQEVNLWELSYDQFEKLK